MWLSVSSTSWDSLDIGDYVKRNLVDAFSSVQGTGRVIVGGINEKAVRVYLNPVKLSANDLDISCLLYTSPSPRDATLYRMPSSA